MTASIIVVATLQPNSPVGTMKHLRKNYQNEIIKESFKPFKSFFFLSECYYILRLDIQPNKIDKNSRWFTLTVVLGSGHRVEKRGDGDGGDCGDVWHVLLCCDADW